MDHCFHMKSDTTKTKLLKELDRIPDDKLPEVYELIRQYRATVQSKESNVNAILSLANSWDSLSEDEFRQLLTDFRERRSKAFGNRRDYGTGTS